jgi:hypothetical protein
MKIILCELCGAAIRSVCKISHLNTKLHKKRMGEKEKQRIKEIQITIELEIFNKECKKAGIKMESEKEIFSAFDELDIDPDAFRDFEYEAMQEELILQQKLEEEKKIEKIENTIQGKEEK